jgi:hypothetical protein
MKRVEESWKEWASSESGAACLDANTLSIPYHLESYLTYRIRAAFVAGWVAKEKADNPDQIIETFDNLLGDDKQ